MIFQTCGRGFESGSRSREPEPRLAAAARELSEPLCMSPRPTPAGALTALRPVSLKGALGILWAPPAAPAPAWAGAPLEAGFLGFLKASGRAAGLLGTH